MGRRILSTSVTKEISMLIETTEGESRFSDRANATKYHLRDLLPMVACTNVCWILPGVVLLVSIARLGKSLQTYLYFLAAGSLARMMS